VWKLASDGTATEIFNPGRHMTAMQDERYQTRCRCP
jgi:hypothetical protein